jgi:hypothetical protein
MAPKQRQKKSKVEDEEDEYIEENDEDQDEQKNDDDEYDEDEEDDENNNYDDDEDEDEDKALNSEYETEDDLDINKDKISDVYVQPNTQTNQFNSLIITGKDRISSPIMTSYEFNRIFSIRMNQIRLGAKPMLQNVPLDTLPEEIVMKELKNKSLPFILFRHTPRGNEEWNISELYIDHLF